MSRDGATSAFCSTSSCVANGTQLLALRLFFIIIFIFSKTRSSTPSGRSTPLHCSRMAVPYLWAVLPCPSRAAATEPPPLELNSTPAHLALPVLIIPEGFHFCHGARASWSKSAVLETSSVPRQASGSTAHPHTSLSHPPPPPGRLRQNRAVLQSPSTSLLLLYCLLYHPLSLSPFIPLIYVLTFFPSHSSPLTLSSSPHPSPELFVMLWFLILKNKTSEEVPVDLYELH